MDKIIIRDLRCNAIIGTLEHERKRRQEVRAALEIGLNLAPAGVSDDLTLSVNYAEIERRTVEIIENSEFLLLEALASAIGGMVLEYPPVLCCTVRLAKPRALKNGEVEIVMNFVRDGEKSGGR